MERKQTNVRIPQTLRERIMVLANSSQKSFNQEVTDLLEEAVTLQEQERHDVTRYRVTRALQEGGYDDGIVARIWKVLRGE